MADDGGVPLTDFERAELDRIAVAPDENTRVFFNTSDRFLGDDPAN
jgi:hypothetical protein